MRLSRWLTGVSVLLSAPCHAASVCFAPLCGTKGLEGWAFDVGMAMITDSDIGEVLLGNVERASGKAGGEVYSVTVTRRLGELRWEIGGQTFTPQLEIPTTLEFVNENGSQPFLDYNLSFAVRWVDFPWNDTIKTTFMMGIGLSFSDRVWQVDKDRHPGDDRSKLKFDWPIQLTFSMPEHPQDQITLFIAHHSGGHTFDVGGINCIGMGCRREF